jgi:NitT/TauT family transport system permease protein
VWNAVQARLAERQTHRRPEHGLDQTLAYLQSTFNMDGVIGPLLVLALLGLSVTAVMNRAEKSLLAWQ